MNSNESSAHNMFSLVPSKESICIASAPSFSVNIYGTKKTKQKKTKKTFGSVITIKSHLKRHSWLVTWSLLKINAKREGKDALMCSRGV